MISLKLALVIGCLSLFAICSPAHAEDLGQVKSVRINIYEDNAPEGGKHGDVIADFANKKGVKLTAKPNAREVKIASDHKTIGWIAGDVEMYREDPWYFSKALVVYRDGKIIQTVKPARFVYSWAFKQDGRQLVVASQGMHGSIIMELFDISTGKKLGRSMNYDKKKPSWTKYVPDPHKIIFD